MFTSRQQLKHHLNVLTRRVDQGAPRCAKILFCLVVALFVLQKCLHVRFLDILSLSSDHLNDNLMS